MTDTTPSSTRTITDTTPSSTRTMTVIKASPETLYRAFTDPTALAVWRVPGTMTGKIHWFDLRVGGGYEMSLYYPSSAATTRGKTAELEDRFRARFVALVPATRIVEAITFETDDPAYAGEMTMVVTFEGVAGGTRVSLTFSDIPAGIRLADNEAGTQSSLQKLARYVAE